MSKIQYTRDELEAMEIDVLDHMAFGVCGGQVINLSPDSIKIVYFDDLINPQHRFKKEGKAWVDSVNLSEPVDVNVEDDGSFTLQDGHHRWFAAKMREEPLQARLQIKGRPIEKILAGQEARRPAPKR